MGARSDRAGQASGGGRGAGRFPGRCWRPGRVARSRSCPDAGARGRGDTRARGAVGACVGAVGGDGPGALEVRRGPGGFRGPVAASVVHAVQPAPYRTGKPVAADPPGSRHVRRRSGQDEAGGGLIAPSGAVGQQAAFFGLPGRSRFTQQPATGPWPGRHRGRPDTPGRINDVFADRKRWDAPPPPPSAGPFLSEPLPCSNM